MESDIFFLLFLIKPTFSGFIQLNVVWHSFFLFINTMTDEASAENAEFVYTKLLSGSVEKKKESLNSLKLWSYFELIFNFQLFTVFHYQFTATIFANQHFLPTYLASKYYILYLAKIPRISVFFSCKKATFVERPIAKIVIGPSSARVQHYSVSLLRDGVVLYHYFFPGFRQTFYLRLGNNVYKHLQKTYHNFNCFFSHFFSAESILTF